MNIFDNIAKNVKKATVPAVESLTEKEIDGLAFTATTNEDYDTLGAAMEALGVETVYAEEKVDKDDLSPEELHQLSSAGMEDEDPDDYEDEETVEMLVDGYIDEAYADEASDAIDELTAEDLEDIEDDEGMESYLSAEQLMEYEAAEEGKITDRVKSGLNLDKSYSCVKRAYDDFKNLKRRPNLKASLAALVTLPVSFSATYIPTAAVYEKINGRSYDFEDAVSEFFALVGYCTAEMPELIDDVLKYNTMGEKALLGGIAAVGFAGTKSLVSKIDSALKTKALKTNKTYMNSYNKVTNIYNKVTETYHKLKKESTEDRQKELIVFNQFCRQMAQVIIQELKAITRDLKSLLAEVKAAKKNPPKEKTSAEIAEEKAHEKKQKELDRTFRAKSTESFSELLAELSDNEDLVPIFNEVYEAFESYYISELELEVAEEGSVRDRTDSAQAHFEKIKAASREYNDRKRVENIVRRVEERRKPMTDEEFKNILTPENRAAVEKAEEERRRREDDKKADELAARRQARRIEREEAEAKKPINRMKAALIKKHLMNAGSKVSLSKAAAGESFTGFTEEEIDELTDMILATEGFDEIAEEDYASLCEEIIAEESVLDEYSENDEIAEEGRIDDFKKKKIDNMQDKLIPGTRLFKNDTVGVSEKISDILEVNKKAVNAVKLHISKLQKIGGHSDLIAKYRDLINKTNITIDFLRKSGHAQNEVDRKLMVDHLFVPNESELNKLINHLNTEFNHLSATESYDESDLEAAEEAMSDELYDLNIARKDAKLAYKDSKLQKQNVKADIKSAKSENKMLKKQSGDAARQIKILREQLRDSAVSVKNQQRCIKDLRKQCKHHPKNEALAKRLGEETTKLARLIDRQFEWNNEIRRLEQSIFENKNTISHNKTGVNDLKRDLNLSTRDIRDAKRSMIEAKLAYKDQKAAEKAVVDPSEEIISDGITDAISNTIELFKEQSAIVAAQTNEMINDVQDIVDTAEEAIPEVVNSKGNPFLEVRNTITNLFKKNQMNNVAVASFCFGMSPEEIATESIGDVTDALESYAEFLLSQYNSDSDEDE